VEDGEGGREGGPGAVVGSAGRPTSAPDHWARATLLLREQGRAAGVGEGARAADVWDQGEMWDPVSVAGCRSVKGSKARRWQGADTRARAAQRRATRFKQI
jgi:hypothetical protein